VTTEAPGWKRKRSGWTKDFIPPPVSSPTTTAKILHAIAAGNVCARSVTHFGAKGCAGGWSRYCYSTSKIGLAIRAPRVSSAPGGTVLMAVMKNIMCATARYLYYDAVTGKRVKMKPPFNQSTWLHTLLPATRGYPLEALLFGAHVWDGMKNKDPWLCGA